MRMKLQQIVNRLRRNEDGHTMIAVVGAIALVSLLVGAALAATNGDLRLTRRDLDDKRAYAAAQAGIADYVFHLNTDNTYWSKCTAVPSPHAVNQNGSTTNRRTVPGDTAQYAIELIPATGQTSCSTSNPNTTMLESGSVMTGSFRIRSTGFANNAKQSVVATFKRASLLDFLYFTQLETSDPVNYGDPAIIAGAYQQCTKYLREGRMDDPIPGSNGNEYCDRIVFVTGDNIDGPLHTNDALQICGTPVFGRTTADSIEVSSPPTGWTGHCGGTNQPNFQGTFVTNAPVLTPPPTNAALQTIAGASNTYTGQTTIVLSGTNTIITSGGTTVTKAIPASGVIYVKNGTCSTSYSPFTITYPTTSGCGNVRVSGSYSGQLTIATENDVIIEDDVTRSGSGMLGLIANNFIRVKHPVCPSSNLGCSSGTITSQTLSSCNSGVNGTGTQSNLTIHAAMLAINHSFIVDHYNCGASLGELTVQGAIMQKFRGAVGTTGGTGYLKDYSYDDRLRYQEPPHFLDPIETAWHIQRQTLDFP